MANPTVVTDLTTITDAETATGWSTGALDQDSEVQGAGCIGSKVSNATTAFVYTYGGTALNFNTGGANEGDHVYIWLNCLTPTLDTLTNGGLRLRLGNGTDQGDFYIGGDGTVAGDPYRGGWKNFIVNPAGDFDTIIAGTWTTTGNPTQLTAVSQFGGIIKTIATIMGNFNNGLVDAIRVGKELRIRDGDITTPGDMDDFLLSDEGTVNNKYGIIRSNSGVIFVQGQLAFGYAAPGTASRFEDTNRVISFEDAPVASDFYKISIQGDTYFQIGTKVGSGTTAVGSDGFVIQSANSNAKFTFDASDTNIDVCNIYGTSFRQGNTFNFANICEVIGNTFDQCNEITINNCTFYNNTVSNTTATAALYLTSTNTMANCSFNNNSRAIRIDTAGTYNLADISFSGNTFDILVENSTGEVVINVNGGNTPTVDDQTTGTGTYSVNNSVAYTITGLVASSEVRILSTGTTTELDGVENSGTTFTYNYNHTGDFGVDIVIHHVDYKYIFVENVTMTSSNQSLPIQQILDRDYNNPA